jgi:hypothetical protein
MRWFSDSSGLSVLPVPVGAIYNTSFDVVGRSSAVNIVNSCFW